MLFCSHNTYLTKELLALLVVGPALCREAEALVLAAGCSVLQGHILRALGGFTRAVLGDVTLSCAVTTRGAIVNVLTCSTVTAQSPSALGALRQLTASGIATWVCALLYDTSYIIIIIPGMHFIADSISV